ncbi:Tetratricopeptide repeat-containing protein [Flavobacterium fluvii]|uniref:Tetratricopeptide repeat-containing protein n=1 Tax=Flavobacterium fluvii TaxID=468056 RepID=A0A1M5DNQ4_9FLAO|nr:tetratricopeptide repeat protein [Flavobacterium fluvii]SHF68617.1 Tetratricopeptide repeat-containing protein [Flavobacterium fluvii]
MNKFKIFSVAFMASVSFGNAQDIAQARKAIDGEQYENAKSMLKSILKASPIDGRANFLLGNVYLIQSETDSAKIAYDKGLAGTDGAKLNYVGLGVIDLDKGNTVGAEANFALAIKDAKKKDVEGLIAIGRAYTYSTKPNFKKAIEVLNKAKEINPNDANVQLALGDAYNSDKNQNDAYVAYRNAFQIDPTLLRAKMQLGVLLKGAKSYDEAIKALNEVIAINPNYGPVYREMAETYYKWGRNKPSKSEEYMQTAIKYYEKYLSLTDQSLHSRMRHADFLVLVKDYKALEIEANKMIEMDKVNPRIFRYLGYSAYENGNAEVAIKSLESFIANPNNKVISKDYLYLGTAKFKKGLSADGLSIDPVLYDSGMADIKKAVEMEPSIIEELNEVGKKIFTLKLFKEAAAIFEIGTTDPEFKNYVEDNIYYGLSVYYANNKKDVIPDAAALQKADLAFEKVTVASPTYLDGYFYRGRTNSLMGNDPMTIKYYEEYVAKVAEKGPEEMAKPTVLKRIIESYNTIAASYANTDKVKAAEYFNKTLTLDPTNSYATESLKLLK